MPAISAGDLTLLRQEFHRHELFASILSPRTLWSAQVNGAFDREETTIAFDGGNGANFSWVEAWQTVLVGSTPGSANLGRVRIRSIASGDGGVSGTVEFGHNEVVWANDVYLTFKHNYELWSVFPRLGPAPTFTFFKDNDITYSDQNEVMTPVAIAGSHGAGFLDEFGELTINFPVGNSYPIAPGAAITNHVVTVLPSAGVTVGALSGVNIPVTFTLPGQYWVKTVVTDSNTKTQTTYRCIFVHEDDATSQYYPFVDFRTFSMTGDWASGGWSGTLEIRDNASLSTIPNGALVLVWQRAWYGDTRKHISLMTHRTNVLLAGYVRRDQYSKDKKTGGRMDVDIATIDAILRERFMFSISLASAANPSEWYEYLNGYLTAGRIAHHVYSEHSSLLRVCDVIGLTDNTIQRKYADLDKGNLYEIVDNLVRDAGIRGHLVADKQGRLHLVQDLAYRDDTARAGASTIAEILETDTRQVVEILHRNETEVAFVFVSGFHYDGTDATPLGATSPGSWPAPRGGAQEVHVERQMLTGQSDVNEIAGQIFAVKNNPYPEVRMEFHGNYLGVLEPAIQEWWEINVASGDTIREIIFTDKKLLARNVQVSMSVRGGLMSVSVSFEPEVDGTPGVPYYWPDLPAPGEGGWPDEIGPPGVTIPEVGEGAGMILTASSLQVLPYNVSTWDQRSANAINDAGQDPFWRTKQGTTGPNSAIIFTAEDGQIRRSTDAGQTYTVLSPGNPPNGTFANCEVIQYEGNPFVENEHLFLVREEISAGNWRSWLLLYDESTWAWHQLGGGATEILMLDSDGAGQTAADNWSWAVLESNTYLLVSGVGDVGEYIYLFEIDTDLETVTLIDSMTDTDDATLMRGRLVSMNDDHALLVYSDTSTVPGDSILKARVVDVGGGTISLGAEFTIDQVTDSYHWDAAWQSNTQAMVVYSEFNGDTLYAQPIGINPTTDTTFSGGTAASTNRPSRNFAILGVGEEFVPDVFRNDIFVSYRDPDDGHKLKYFLVNDTLGSVSIGSVTTLDSSALRTSPSATMESVRVGWHDIAALGADHDKMVRMYARSDNLEYAIVVDLADPDNPNVGTPQSSPYDGLYFTAVRRSGSKLAFGSAFDTTVDWATAVVSGLSVEWDENDTDLAGFNGHPVKYLGEGYYAMVGVDSGSDVGAGLAQEAGGGDVKALGMDISKGTGAAIYVTAWAENGEIILVSRQLPGFGVLADWSLGSASLSQVDARTFWAHPFCPFGDDSYVAVFGRLNDAAGLGLAHVIASFDAGASFLAMANDWGDDHAGSMIENGFAELLVVRNIAGKAAKVYVGLFGTGVDLLGTVPFTAGVNPQARALDYFGNLILGANVVNDKMVIIAPPPYDAWFDITGNHSKSGDVNSVEVL